jgi:Protein of unknown function (DUF5131)
MPYVAPSGLHWRCTISLVWANGYPNVWLGTTAEDEKHYHMRWPVLSRIPATRRFVSYEPAVGRLGDLAITNTLPDWIICGGESGPHGLGRRQRGRRPRLRSSDQRQGRRAPRPTTSQGVSRAPRGCPLRYVLATF